MSVQFEYEAGLSERDRKAAWNWWREEWKRIMALPDVKTAFERGRPRGVWPAYWSAFKLIRKKGYASHMRCRVRRGHTGALVTLTRENAEAWYAAHPDEEPLWATERAA